MPVKDEGFKQIRSISELIAMPASLEYRETSVTQVATFRENCRYSTLMSGQKTGDVSCELVTVQDRARGK